MPPNQRCVAFDSEGPLYIDDAAFEIFRQYIPHGAEIFRAISYYDDVLSECARPGYEPGDTLALIAPFLIRYGISSTPLAQLASRATPMPGAKDLVVTLVRKGYEVFAITTAYAPYAIPVDCRAGIPEAHIAATEFTAIEKGLSEVPPDELRAVDSLTEALIDLLAAEETQRVHQLLDEFYWRQLPSTRMGQIVKVVKPLGGRRKVGALRKFADSFQPDLSLWVAVGDSITDNAMLATVRDAGGLAIAFNANRFALERATVGVAARSLKAVEPLILAWEQHGLEAVNEFIRETAANSKGDDAYYQWLRGTQLSEEVLDIHMRFRRAARSEAAALG